MALNKDVFTVEVHHGLYVFSKRFSEAYTTAKCFRKMMELATADDVRVWYDGRLVGTAERGLSEDITWPTTR